VRLDDWLPATVDVVKIDAQGYDHEVLAGLARTLSTNPALVVLAELSLSELGRRGIEPGEVLSGYTELGFTIATLDDRGALRRTSQEQVLSECRAGTLPSDFSLVLQRPPPAAAQNARAARPATAGGLEVSEAIDGLLVYQPVRNRLHRLNTTAAVVFDLCTGERTVAEVVALVQEAFQLDAPPVAEVEQCLAHLRSEGLLS
jgi:hypothetical protein